MLSLLFDFDICENLSGRHHLDMSQQTETRVG